MLCSVYCYLATDDSGQPIGPETSVTANQHCVNTPEDPRPYLHRGGGLKSGAKLLAFACSYWVKARKT
jgi:hypothetical protein